MSGRYWIKLWLDMLEDRKVARLPDRLWRRFVELLLVAKGEDESGKLPDLWWTARLLGLSEEELETDLVELAKPGLVAQVNGVWLIPKFADRQAPKTATERWHIHQRWGIQRSANEAPTHEAPEERRGDSDSEERRKDRRKAPARPETHEAVRVFREETQRYPKKATQPEIENIVGRQPDDLELWRKIVHEWVALGFNPVNVRGMLECFTRRELPGKRGKASEPKSFAAIRQAKAEMEAMHGD